jgi:hypothetical protein
MGLNSGANAPFPQAYRKTVDYILGWPIVAVFLVLSVMLPRWYWTVNMPHIEQEHGQAT